MEGGGQILRVSVALSAATGKPVKIINIRSKRTRPGLQPQHFVAVKAVAQISNAEVKGLQLGSKELEFVPHQLREGDFFFDIGTAGSTTLVLQALMPSLAYTPGEVTIRVKGGTNNPFAPPVEFMQYVLVPTLKRLGYEASVGMTKRGFYPKGGGIIKAISKPIRRLSPLTLTDLGRVIKIRGFSFSSRLPPSVTEGLTSGAEAVLRRAGYQDISIENESRKSWESQCALNEGSGIFLFAETTSGMLFANDALGRKGASDQKTGMDVAEGLLSQFSTGAAVDLHLADQLIVWAAMADGVSVLRTTQLTLHTVTCLEISKKILGIEFQIEGREGEPATIRIEGKGIKNLSTLA